MRYIEVCFAVAEPELQEILASLLDGYGFEGIVFEETGLQAYIPEPQYETFSWEEFVYDYPVFTETTFETRTIEETNWNEVWESGFKPVLVADQVYIRAGFHEERPDIKHELVIEPKMSFGTGHHETTAMMVEAMLDRDFTGKSVLDFGSGTGILAILAAKLGALETVAIDHEHWAYENALENVERNQAKGITVLEGDERSIPQREYDLILANVNKNVIFQNLQMLHGLLVSGGYIFLSGLLKDDEEDTMKLANELGFKLKKALHQGNWICLVFTK